MGLEAPLALLGLLAAALPWLAHRIRRRDLQPVPLPTFALLLAAESKKRRSRGITDLILLVLRIAIVAVVAIALAAPFVSARFSFGDGSVASVAIVIDDSMSMLREERGQTLLAEAERRAADAIASLPRGSEVAIVLGSMPARVLQARTNDLGVARIALDRLPEQSARAGDLPAAIAFAGEQLGGAVHARRRVLVISDFAAHTQLAQSSLRVPGAELTLSRVGAVPPPLNLYVTGVRAVPDPAAAQATTSVAVEIAASGKAPAKVAISLRAQDKELARADVELSDGRGRATLRVPTPDPTADPTASVSIEIEDALPLDNKAGVLLRRTDALHVMLVNGDPHPASRSDELFYALPALRLTPAETASFSLRTIDASALEKHDLTQTDVIVLANVAPPSAAWVERIAEFVIQGGGLLIAPGDHINPRAHQQTFSTLLPCSMRSRVSSAVVGLSADTSAASWLGAGAGPALGLSQVKVRTRLALECDGDIALRFGDGSPALALGRMGRGQTALLALPLDDDWSDLPLRPGYLALLARVVRQLSSTVAPPLAHIPAGSIAKIPVPPTAERMEIVLPDGSRESFTGLDGKTEIELAQTEQPGAYRALAAGSGGPVGDASRGAFVVDAPVAESDLTPLPDLPELERVAGAASAGSTIRRSLAPMVLLVLAGLALAEGLVRLPRGIFQKKR
jgi:hypothetical protein